MCFLEFQFFPGGIVGVLQGSQPQFYESWWPFSNRASSLKKQAMEKEKQTRLYLFFFCGLRFPSYFFCEILFHCLLT